MDRAKILSELYTFAVSALFIVQAYAIIRWIAVMIADRGNTAKRKKYAYMVLICVVILMCMGVLSVAIALARNT
ncbi:MAG: hypothetical protein K5871_05850 [Lachnospiraceae bacterium]|nr:hypothetical protein [Lachnospiraceae bacterium]